MEHLPGGTVAELLAASRTLQEEDALRIARSALGGLVALHDHGIVHRDVKPQNLLLDGRGRAKLADFSIAHEAVSGETMGITADARPAGTLAFMAPEVARGAPAGRASDVYSMGATLYALLAGKPPIPVEGLAEYEARRAIVDGVPALPLPGVSPGTNAALARALATSPDARPTAAELLKLL